MVNFVKNYVIFNFFYNGIRLLTKFFVLEYTDIKEKTMAILNTAQLTSSIEKSGEKVEVVTKSNVQTVNNISTDILVEQTSSKTWVMPKMVFTITTKITNNTNQNIEDIHFSNILTGATFVDGSLKIEGVEYKDFSPQGFTMPVTLGAFGVDVSVSFDVMTDEYPEVDAVESISKISADINSNTFDISSAKLSVDIIENGVVLLKTADKIAVKSGDELTYTITITNSGDIINTDAVFLDEIPNGTRFVENSVTINGEVKVGYNPQNSFAINDINPNDTVTITFKVTIL